MAGGSVWFRANIGRQKNAEARWLLPMICRRGGINKNDIGAIRIYDAHTEIEIAGQAAEEFSLKIKRADKENIRIEPLQGGAPGETPSGSSVDQAASAGTARDNNVRQDDKPRDQSGPKNEPKNEPKSEPKSEPKKELRNDPNKRYGGPRHGDKRHGDKRDGERSGERPHKFDKKRGFDKKKRPDNRPAHSGQPPSGQPPREGAAPFANRPFGKKPKKKKYRG
jgi:ATP-dependent RNA helicase DeaD